MNNQQYQAYCEMRDACADAIRAGGTLADLVARALAEETKQRKMLDAPRREYVLRSTLLAIAEAWEQARRVKCDTPPKATFAIAKPRQCCGTTLIIGGLEVCLDCKQAVQL